MEFRYPKSPVEIEGDKKKAKRVYWWTWSSTLLAFIAGGSVLGHVSGQHWMGQFNYIQIMLANFAAAHACRIAGVSMESQSTENIERDPRAALAPYLSEAPIFELGRGKSSLTNVDREGICHGKKRLLWRDVETCDVNQKRNAIGTLTTIIKINRLGKDKKKRLLIVTNEENAARLLPAIRFYLRGGENEPAST